MSFHKYYPLNPPKRVYSGDPNFTGYNNVSYVGDSLSIYEQRATTLSNEDIIVNLNKYNPIESQEIIPAYFSESRPTPILPYKADRYKLSVLGVYLPESSIYLFEWVDQIIPALSTTPYDKYTVTVTYWDGGTETSSTVPLQYEPYNLADLANNIKHVYEINQCIISLNRAYATAFTNLSIPYDPPVFTIDKNTSLIGYYVPTTYNDPTGVNGTNPNPSTWLPGNPWVKLGWNYWVNQWFGTSFSSIQLNNTISNIESNVLRIYDNGDPSSIVTISGNPYYNFWQESSTTELFSTVEKIVVTSSIQSRPQYTSITALNTINNIVPNTMQSVNILIDFPYTLSSFNNSESSSPIIYTPNTMLFQDILTQDTLSLLSYQLFVQRTNGILQPLSLRPGQMMSIKLLFRLK